MFIFEFFPEYCAIVKPEKVQRFLKEAPLKYHTRFYVSVVREEASITVFHIRGGWHDSIIVLANKKADVDLIHLRSNCIKQEHFSFKIYMICCLENLQIQMNIYVRDVFFIISLICRLFSRFLIDCLLYKLSENHDITISQSPMWRHHVLFCPTNRSKL